MVALALRTSASPVQNQDSGLIQEDAVAIPIVPPHLVLHRTDPALHHAAADQRPLLNATPAAGVSQLAQNRRDGLGAVRAEEPGGRIAPGGQRFPRPRPGNRRMQHTFDPRRGSLRQPQCGKGCRREGRRRRAPRHRLPRRRRYSADPRSETALSAPNCPSRRASSPRGRVSRNP